MNTDARAAAKHRDEARTPTSRERLLETAYAMFAARGVRDVGVDEVIERADVAKATLYRHFPSKDDLVVAFLEEREQRWTVDWVEAEARGRGSEPEQQLLAIFDLFDEWFHRQDFEGCAFINVMLEMGLAHPAGSAACVISRTSAQWSVGLPRRPASRSSLVRALVAHPDEGVDRAGRRGRSRRRGASQIDGPPADRRAPLGAEAEPGRLLAGRVARLG